MGRACLTLSPFSSQLAFPLRPRATAAWRAVVGPGCYRPPLADRPVVLGSGCCRLPLADGPAVVGPGCCRPPLAGRLVDLGSDCYRLRAYFAVDRKLVLPARTKQLRAQINCRSSERSLLPPQGSKFGCENTREPNGSTEPLGSADLYLQSERTDWYSKRRR